LKSFEGFVADASVGVSWAVSSQSSPAAKGLLEEVAAGKPFVLPGLWILEVANALLVLTHRKKSRRSSALAPAWL